MGTGLAQQDGKRDAKYLKAPLDISLLHVLNDVIKKKNCYL